MCDFKVLLLYIYLTFYSFVALSYIQFKKRDDLADFPSRRSFLNLCREFLPDFLPR
jgi:hypothetical protein